MLYLCIVSLYPLGVNLTGNPFDATSPLLEIRGGRGAKILNFIYFTMASSEQEAHGPHRSPEKTIQINKHI